MARFTLVLKPNGKALLVTPENLDPGQMALLQRLWEEWKSDEGRDVLFISGTEVVMYDDIELDLEAAMAEKSNEDLVEKRADADVTLSRPDNSGSTDPEQPEDVDTDTPKSVTGDASPTKRG